MTQGMFSPSLSTLTNLSDSQGYSGLLYEPCTPTQIDDVLTEYGGLYMVVAHKTLETAQWPNSFFSFWI